MRHRTIDAVRSAGAAGGARAAGGAGAAAGLLLGLLDALAGGATSPRTLATAAIVTAAAGAALALAGLALGAGGAALLRRLGLPLRAETALALGDAALAGAGGGALAWALLSGRVARTIPGRPLLAAACALTIGLGAFVTCRAAAAPRPGRLVAPLALVAALGALALDRTLLVRRYDALHLGLEAAALFALKSACAARPRRAGPGARAATRPSAAAALARLAPAALARLAPAALALLAPAAGVALWALAGDEAQAARAELHERARIGARLADAARAVAGRLRPAPPAPLPPPASPPLLAPAPAVAGAPLAGADVVLVTVDALRADHLGLHGYGRPTSPRLDALAREGIVFERAYASTPHTSFSLASLLTGRHAFSLARLGRLDGLPTLADRFRAAGYLTAGVFPPAVFFVEGERFRGLEARRYGFERVRHDSLAEAEDAVRRTDDAIALLEAAGRRPVFLWVHHFAPHEPYVHHADLGPPPFGTRDVDRYDEEIRWTDREIGRLLDHLAKTRPGAIVIVTADHGEEFGERGGAYHGTTLFDEQVRVPLVMRLPGIAPARVPLPVSTVDVAPTLAALTGVGVDAGYDGADLAPALLDPGAVRPELWAPRFAELEQLKMAAVGRHKIVCDLLRDFCRLYDLVADPGERRDVGAAGAARAAELRAVVRRWAARTLAAPAGAVSLGAGPAGTGEDELFDAAERSDPEALRRLAGLLRAARPSDEPGAAAARRAAAARALGRAPSVDHRDALAAAAQDPDPGVRGWGAVGLGQLGDRRALEPLELPLLWVGAPVELRARRALALLALRARGGIPAVEEALAAEEDVNTRCRLVRALAQTRAPEARPLLVAAYPHVRSRSCVAEAFTALRDPAALPFLAARLADEPYVTVRAALARALGETGSPAAVPALEAAFRREAEPGVAAAAARALAALGAAAPVRPKRPIRPPSAAKELWVVAPRARGAPVTVRLATADQELRAEIDTGIERDAYELPLPPGTSASPVEVLGPGEAVLFR